MKVLKFGGTSVATAENMQIVCDILQKNKETETTFVICSAMGGVTDLLLDMSRLAADGDEAYKDKLSQFSARHIGAAKALVSGDLLYAVMADLEENHETLAKLLEGIFLIKEVSLRTADYLLSFGERNSCYIIAHYLKSIGVKAEYLDARKVVKTDSNFGYARVDFDVTNKNIQDYNRTTDTDFVITTGFVASTDQGVSTTLGRGGSDYTASIFSAALDAKALEIWTDVTGVLTTDPRKVKSAYTVPYLHYQEAMELSHFGAKVIYPPTIQPVCAKNIPIFIKNTFEPEAFGTEIGNKTNGNEDIVKGLSAVSDISLITLEGAGLHGVPGTASRLFSALARAEVNIIMITQASSEHSICFAVKDQDSPTALQAIQKEFEREIDLGLVNLPKFESALCILAIVGLGMRNMRGVAGKLFGVLGKNGVNIKAIAQGSSELNISFVIEKKDHLKGLNLVHESFFLSDIPQLNLFMVGIGLIGGTLINQIKENQERLKEVKQVDIRIVGISRSSKMIINAEGIDLNHWESLLAQGTEISNIDTYVYQVIQQNMRNAVFVDCTASDLVPQFYEQILNANISVSTPNKVASSSSFENYSKLKEIAKKKNIHLKYETNVGAGLPVISTIKNLIDSGDEITSIEGVLSGSCSFVFNTFDQETSFYDAVKQAGELGLTEPDPRDDLSGKDIQRKITILAREAGFAIDTKDVIIEPVLPEYCSSQPTVAAFLDSLQERNAHFESMAKTAAHKDQRLRYVAKYENGKASVSLISVDNSHPFYNLQGSDNMIVIKSKRYSVRPLVVSGPGAGAEVTAAGVFAEIISMI